MELSNQLVGRIKNRLCSLGIHIENTLPRAISHHALLVTVRERKSAPWVYVAGDYPFVVWFDVVVNETVRAGTLIEPLREGDVVTL